MPLFRRRPVPGPRVIPEGQPVMGLVVPPPARIVYDAKGNLIYDELAEMEHQGRMRGRTIINFIDE